MFFHDEIRPSKEIAPKKTKVPKAELEMATALIEQFTADFEPASYEDTYREALLKLIKAKQKGETITAVPAAEDDERPTDLLTRRSRRPVEERQAAQAGRSGRRGLGPGPPRRRKPAKR